MNRFEFAFMQIFGPDKKIADRESSIQKDIDREGRNVTPNREGAIPRRLKDAVGHDGKFRTIA
jgi:hypothetical protein